MNSEDKDFWILLTSYFFKWLLFITLHACGFSNLIYLCVCVCVLALAVHIELVGDSQYEEKLSYYDCLTHTHTEWICEHIKHQCPPGSLSELCMVITRLTMSFIMCSFLHSYFSIDIQ